MSDTPTVSWRDRVRVYDPVAHEKMLDYLGHITGKDAIAPKYRELVLFASSSVARYRTSMVTHGKRSLDLGATSEELFQAGALAALSGGFTVLIEVISVLDEIGAAPDQV